MSLLIVLKANLKKVGRANDRSIRSGKKPSLDYRDIKPASLSEFQVHVLNIP